MSVFLSTPSARRATQGLEQYNRHNQNFYPRPLRGGRLLLVFEQAGLFVISIHALCEEGDVVLIGQFAGGVISIHALCEEGDVMDNAYQTLLGQFLSTPSARRATPANEPDAHRHQISIHALCEEGDPSATASRPSASYFYPRPLRGGRQKSTGSIGTERKFLSTPSARRATFAVPAFAAASMISIHALCEEGDPETLPPWRR